MEKKEKEAIEYVKFMIKNIDFNRIGYLYGKESLEELLNIVNKVKENKE